MTHLELFNLINQVEILKLIKIHRIIKGLRAIWCEVALSRVKVLGQTGNQAMANRSPAEMITRH